MSLVRAGSITLFLLPFAAAVEPGLPSRTAVSAAIGRAIGAKYPDSRFRNADYLAIKFLGPKERALVPDFPVEILELDYADAIERYPRRDFVTAMFARTKFFDDTLDQALREHARQVVILGAGFDSRGYRFADRLSGVNFFEVDFPATQEYKKQRVKEIFGKLPGHIRYVPMDFTKDDLLIELRKAGYSEEQKTMFVWEAVVFYLPEAAVKATLHFVRDHSGTGSIIAFDYALSRDPRVVKPGAPLPPSRAEPWIFGFPNNGAAAFVRAEGLEIVKDNVGLDSPIIQMLMSSKSTLPKPDLRTIANFGQCVARVPLKR